MALPAGCGVISIAHQENGRPNSRAWFLLQRRLCKRVLSVHECMCCGSGDVISKIGEIKKQCEARCASVGEIVSVVVVAVQFPPIRVCELCGPRAVYLRVAAFCFRQKKWFDLMFRIEDFGGDSKVGI